jgi:hypothetical protein
VAELTPLRLSFAAELAYTVAAETAHVEVNGFGAQLFGVEVADTGEGRAQRAGLAGDGKLAGATQGEIRPFGLCRIDGQTADAAKPGIDIAVVADERDGPGTIEGEDDLVAAEPADRAGAHAFRHELGKVRLDQLGAQLRSVGADLVVAAFGVDFQRSALLVGGHARDIGTLARNDERRLGTLAHHEVDHAVEFDGRDARIDRARFAHQVGRRGSACAQGQTEALRG